MYAFSERNGVIVRVCLCYFLMPETINDLFTHLRSMKMTQPSLYKAWEKAFELRKKVNAQSLTIEILC